MERKIRCAALVLAAACAAAGARADDGLRAAALEDWILQDAGAGGALEAKVVGKVISELGAEGCGFAGELRNLVGDNAPADDPRWRELYTRACEERRARRLRPVLVAASKIVFVKRETIRPSFFAYTEGQSDAQAERHFHPGSSLCLLEMDGGQGKVRTLLEDPAGMLRDPCVSHDGRRIAFAWKKSLDGDDYHLYEMEAATGRIRQITFGNGFADCEPCYLPDDSFIFASTRCVQTVDCFWTEVSNLYTCDKDGRFLRRLGFDQVHAVYPAVTDDGRVTYTRWDYNDRGQVFPQPLFQMNPDGTGQMAFYGMNSWFPTTIAHARNIPGTQRMLAILCGHHSPQTGKVAILDPARGREENDGVQLVAPVRTTEAVRVDAYGQDGELFAYPYPLSGTHFLATYAPLGWQGAGKTRQRTARFGLYAFDINGRRELLAADPNLSCQQPFPLVARPRPHMRPSLPDYRQSTGTCYMQDIHAGQALADVTRGTIKRLRVVALDFRAAGIGSNLSSGPGGAALISTPVAIGNGTWDVKIVLGDAVVYEDGSAFFTVPARTPVYFQALDEKGRAVQTMRSWNTLQPGENQACVGCHDAKNSAPPPASHRATLALRAGAQPLEPFHGPPRGFSFAKEIQPILDRHCVSCHNDRDAAAKLLSGERQLRPLGETNLAQKAFSLLGAAIPDADAKRAWSEAYLVLTQAQPDKKRNTGGRFTGDCEGPVVNWISSQSAPPTLPSYAAGSTRSWLMRLLDKGHGGTALSRAEMEKFACWIDLLVPFCGDYREAGAWTQEEKTKYEHFLAKRRAMEEIERRNIADFTAATQMPEGLPIATPKLLKSNDVIVGHGTDPGRSPCVR